MRMHQHITAEAAPLGRVFPLPELGGEGLNAYNNSGGTLLAGQPVQIEYGITEDQEVLAGVPATSASIYRETAINVKEIATTKDGKFQISGLAEALVDVGAPLAAGRYLEVIDSGTYLVDEGTSRTASSVGILKDAITAAEVAADAALEIPLGYIKKTVLILPFKHFIQAS